jgi:hypothetical protein
MSDAGRDCFNGNARTIACVLIMLPARSRNQVLECLVVQTYRIAYCLSKQRILVPEAPGNGIPQLGVGAIQSSSIIPEPPALSRWMVGPLLRPRGSRERVRHGRANLN